MPYYIAASTEPAVSGFQDRIGGDYKTLNLFAQHCLLRRGQAGLTYAISMGRGLTNRNPVEVGDAEIKDIRDLDGGTLRVVYLNNKLSGDEKNYSRKVS